MKRGKARSVPARLAPLALACALALPWGGPARAERSVFFVAADEIVLPLSDDTMPFWEGGYLYISSGIFSETTAGGAARRNLNIGLAQNNDQDRVTLYREKDSLEFEMGINFAVDPDGEIHYPGAIWRNGRVFVSAHLVAEYFGLLYSVIAVEHGSLVWLRNRSFRLQEQAFADAASYQLNTTYQEYLDAKSPPSPAPPEEPARSDSAEAPYRSDSTEPPARSDSAEAPVRSDSAEAPSSPGTAAEPAEPPSPPDRPQNSPPTGTAENPPPSETPDQTVPETPPEIRGGVDLYLCLRAGENTASLLDTLDASGIRAAFFCDRDFLEQEGGLLRRMAASGHSIGLYLPGADSPAEQAEYAERLEALLERAVCFQTRLVCLDGGTDAAREALRALGYVCLEPGPAVPRTASRREAFLREAVEQGGGVAAWLGDSAGRTELAGLLDAVQKAEDHCLPLTEASLP